MSSVVCVDLHIIAATRHRHVCQPAIDEFLSGLLGVHMNEHAVGGLSLAAVTVDRVAVVDVPILYDVARDRVTGIEADLTGAIQHAMAALECVARDVCGDEQATLGEIIKRYPGTIPKLLDDLVAKAWGYASEMARHILEGHKPERKDVELIVGLAATVATYLSR